MPVLATYLARSIIVAFCLVGVRLLTVNRYPVPGRASISQTVTEDLGRGFPLEGK